MPPSCGPGSELERGFVYRVVRQLFARHLLVDDAHWADAESLACLARRVGDAPVLTVVAWRDEDPSADARLVHEILAAPEVELVTLEPLTRDAIRQMLVGAPDPDLVEACETATDIQVGRLGMSVVMSVDRLELMQLLEDERGRAVDTTASDIRGFPDA